MANWGISVDGAAMVSFSPVIVEGVEFGVDSFRAGDTPRPYGDGIIFGQDFVDPSDIVLSVALRVKPGGSLALMREAVRVEAVKFARLWDAAAVRVRPGVVAELNAGELGVFEGRPRRVQWDWSGYRDGVLRGTATWVRSSNISYLVDSSGAAVWHSVEVGLVPEMVGGLVAPLAEPLSTTAASSRSQTFTVGGESRVWPVITVSGPVSAARVDLVGCWSLPLSVPLRFDDEAVIDTRPGRESMFLNGRARNVLMPSAVLADAFIEPGIRAVALRGTSAEGVASVRLEWREAREGA